MGVRVARVGLKTLAGDCEGVFDCVVESGCRFGRGRGRRGFRSPDAAEIVVHGHVSAAERDAQPQRAGQPAIGRAVLRVGGDGLAVRVARQVAIEIVDFSRSLGSERRRFTVRERCGRDSGSHNRQRQGRERSPKTHDLILRRLRLHELVPSAYNCPLVRIKQALSVLSWTCDVHKESDVG